MKILIYVIILFFLISTCKVKTKPENTDIKKNEIYEHFFSNVSDGDFCFQVLYDTIDIPNDLISFPALKLKGFTYEQISKIYGVPQYQKIDTLKYGINKRGNEGDPIIYSLTYNIPLAEICYCRWDNVDTVNTLKIYLQKNSHTWEVIFGYMINYNLEKNMLE